MEKRKRKEGVSECWRFWDFEIFDFWFRDFLNDFTILNFEFWSFHFWTFGFLISYFVFLVDWTVRVELYVYEYTVSVSMALHKYVIRTAVLFPQISLCNSTHPSHQANQAQTPTRKLENTKMTKWQKWQKWQKWKWPKMKIKKHFNISNLQPRNHGDFVLSVLCSLCPSFSPFPYTVHLVIPPHSPTSNTTFNHLVFQYSHVNPPYSTQSWFSTTLESVRPFRQWVSEWVTVRSSFKKPKPPSSPSPPRYMYLHPVFPQFPTNPSLNTPLSHL